MRDGSKEGPGFLYSWTGCPRRAGDCGCIFCLAGDAFCDSPSGFFGDLLGDFNTDLFGGLCGGLSGHFPGNFVGDISGDRPGDSVFTGEFSADAGGDMRTTVRARIKSMAFERLCVFWLPGGFSSSA